MATVKIDNVDDARNAAAKYGVPWPTGKGRKPTAKLWYAITAKGDEIAGSYLHAPKAPLVTTETIGTSKYAVTRSVMVPRQTAKGEKLMPSKETVTLTVGEIRTLNGTLGRKGRISLESILYALVALRAAGAQTAEWTDEDIAKAEPVAVKPDTGKAKLMHALAVVAAAKAAIKPAAVVVATATEDIAEDTDTETAKDLVSVDLSPSDAASA